MSTKSSSEKIYDEPYLNSKFSPPRMIVPISNANLNKKRKKSSSISKKRPPVPGFSTVQSVNQSNSQDSVQIAINNNQVTSENNFLSLFLGELKKSINIPTSSDHDFTDVFFKDYGQEINSLKICSVALCPN